MENRQTIYQSQLQFFWKPISLGTAASYRPRLSNVVLGRCEKMYFLKFQIKYYRHTRVPISACGRGEKEGGNVLIVHRIDRPTNSTKKSGRGKKERKKEHANKLNQIIDSDRLWNYFLARRRRQESLADFGGNFLFFIFQTRPAQFNHFKKMGRKPEVNRVKWPERIAYTIVEKRKEIRRDIKQSDGNQIKMERKKILTWRCLR